MGLVAGGGRDVQEPDVERQLCRHRHHASPCRLSPAELLARAGRHRIDRRRHDRRLAHRCLLKDRSMQDLLWIAFMLGLVAATLAYVRLCDHA
ncbi:conserved hypothetical protein [Sphingomonas aurantiaca]|uniref:Uncharacterized protein n=1 Tax=Sphingomonas aurantiaca TaxID=185949 RepID=A0A5E8A9C5_9SPHN|nr:conserved hypothetical protein [Sphingomonas aurantiaca]